MRISIRFLKNVPMDIIRRVIIPIICILDMYCTLYILKVVLSKVGVLSLPSFLNLLFPGVPDKFIGSPHMYITITTILILYTIFFAVLREIREERVFNIKSVEDFYDEKESASL